VQIGLRVTNNYPYEGLVLEVEQKFQHPYSHRADTIKYMLTDESGDFTENGINYYQYESQSIPLDLKKGQTGEIRIRHLMHREVLPGIMDVGVRVFR
jgi:gliding motility-associated lipoprotein GldH